MLITILERDMQLINSGPYKLKKPYIDKISNALRLVQQDLKDSNAYLRDNKIQVIKGKNDGLCTEFNFVDNGCDHVRIIGNVFEYSRSRRIEKS